MSALPESLDFGDVAIGGSGEITLTLTNRGETDLEITAIRPKLTENDDVFAVSPEPPFQVAAEGGEIELRVEFSPLLEKDYADNLMLESNDPDSPYGLPMTGRGITGCVDSDEDGSCSDVDCDDANPAVYPGADELCDLLDNDCDEETDEGFDQDGDGHLDIQACQSVGGDDCDDANPAVYPGADELCDLLDNDCDNLVDDADPGVTGRPTWYPDSDGDGWGTCDVAAMSCQQPFNYVGQCGDCDDTDPRFHPGAPEDDCTDLTDYNCDRSVGYSDADGDGFAACEDCDDNNPGVHPGVDEICDGLDNDCDQLVDEGFDQDGDGHRDGYACRSVGGDDCDDTREDVYRGAMELCDGIDNDCDKMVDEGFDQDGDGHLDIRACQSAGGDDCDDTREDVYSGATEQCDGIDNDCDEVVDEDFDQDGDGHLDAKACEFIDGDDCNDQDKQIYPGAPEVCNSIDDDCDGFVDGDDDNLEVESSLTWYLDADGDGYGRESPTRTACAQPDGYVSRAGDCDDTQSEVHPGADELCDGQDNDCDGVIDEEAVDALPWYFDGDSDAWGTSASSTKDCSQPPGYVPESGDCNDNNGLVHPEAGEYCNEVDDDCDGTADEDAENPRTWYRDSDNDGYGDPQTTTQSCSTPAGYIGNSRDCDDKNPNVHPGASEYCNDRDDDCDGTVDEGAVDARTWYQDADKDGYGNFYKKMAACSQPTDYVLDSTDCNDSCASCHPGGVEVCDKQDNDCNNLVDDDAINVSIWYNDGDGDGYGTASLTVEACDCPPGYSPYDTDCDDTDPSVYPGEPERCDGKDNNCDNHIDEGLSNVTLCRDADGDGFGDPGDTISGCSDRDGYVADCTDCDDTATAAHPGGLEVWYNGIDEDCDKNDGDQDGDGFWVEDYEGLVAESGTGRAPFAVPVDDYGNPLDTDCDDTSVEINPEAPEIVDTNDNNCDGLVDAPGDDPNAPYTCTIYLPDNYTSIQEAVDNSVRGDVICLRPEIYEGVPVDPLDETVLGGPLSGNAFVDFGGHDDITLIGLAGKSNTILYGSEQTCACKQTENRVLYAGNGERGLVVGYLTLTHGGGCYSSARDGGGMYAGSQTDVLLTHVVLSNNNSCSGGKGGALYVGGDARLNEVEVSGNFATSGGGGIYAGGFAQVEIVGSLISGNSSSGVDGGGLFVNSAATLTMEHTVVLMNSQGNWGGGMTNNGNSSIFDVLFADNVSVYGGGAIQNNGTLSLFNTVFANNYSAGQGGAISTRGTVDLAESLVFIDNTATTGGALYVYGGKFNRSLRNSVFLQNSARTYAATYGASASIIYSDFWENTCSTGGTCYECASTSPYTCSGEGVLHVDPGFLDISSSESVEWDYHLASMNLVDKGDPSTFDPDGSRADMGRYSGPLAASLDLDYDTYYDWWEPMSRPPTCGGSGEDCDDGNPEVH